MLPALVVVIAALACGDDGIDFGSDDSMPTVTTADAHTEDDDGSPATAGDTTDAQDPNTTAGATTNPSESSSAADDGPGDASTGATDGPSFGSGSNFTDVMQMFDYVNEQRQGYLPHERWRGLPWTGQQHTTVTWPTTFEWDEGLADEAQSLANALAAGAAPLGSPATDGITPPIYVADVDTAHYVVSGREGPGSWGVPNESSLSAEHGSARMAIFYHDPGGRGPVLTRLGVGACDGGDGGTWWTFVWE